MAIFGNLKQISLGDLLPLLKSQRGSLEIFNLDGISRVTLYVESGRLISLLVAGRPVDDIQVRSVIGSLMNAKHGSFEFIPGVSPRQRHPKGWDLDRLMLAVTTIADEMVESEDNFPHPDTVFRLLVDVEPEDGRVADFWGRARQMLVDGASSRQLSQTLGVPLNHAGYYMLKLRQAGLIEPIRAASANPSKGGLAGRLLGALKRRFLGF